MSQARQIFLHSLITGIMLLSLILANPGFAYAVESSAGVFSFAAPAVTPNTTGGIVLPASTSAGTGSTSTGGSTSGIVLPGGSGSGSTVIPNSVPAGTCSVSQLKPSEVKGILDLTHEGFNGKTISDKKIGDSNDSNKNGVKDLGDMSAIGKDISGKQAVKVDLPTIAAPANRFAFFDGSRITGPFGIGLILDDTLRVGRCDYPAQEQALCKINGSGLQVRTSGVGFTSDITNAFNSLKNTGKNLAENALSPDDYNKMRGNYLDINSNDFTTGSFGTGAQLKNSILTQQYNARNATTCNNSSCVISTYSAFDKYFNSWLTTDMVVSNIGPTLLHKGYKLFTKGAKSFGDGSLAGPWNQVMKAKRMVSPSEIFGKQRYAKYNALIKEEGFGKIFEPLTIQGKLFSSGAAGEIDKLVAKDSPIWKLDSEQRKKFFEAVEHLRAYSIANSEAMSAAEAAFKAQSDAASLIANPAARALAEKNAKISWGQDVSRVFNDWDDTVFLDSPAWLAKNEDLLSLGGYAMKRNGPPGAWPDGQGYIDVSTSGSFNFKEALKKFRDEGGWSGWANSTDAKSFAANADGSLKLYKISEEGTAIAQNVGLQDLKFHLSKSGSGTYSVKLPDGRLIPLNDASIDMIAGNPALPGHVTIFKSTYVEATPLTPEDFANRVTHSRITGRPNTAVRNMDDLHNALLQNDFAPRRFTSALDEQFAKEGDMIKKYYKDPTVGIYKGTILPVFYWNAKRGFGQEQFSAFMLPDTWTTLTVSQGTDKIYKDSYIDFYANEGSDQGDMFKRAFNSLAFVWTKALDLAAETNTFLKDGISKVSGGFFEGSATRDIVGDLAFYSHNESCAGCTGNINFKNNYFTLNGFNSGIAMQAFLLEAKTPEEKAKEGSLIVSYTHHSNLNGKSTQIEGGSIDIAKARISGETCDQKLRKMGLGWAGSGAGGVLALAENLGYVVGFGPGLVASLVQQMYFGRELQDCVDDVEGYYTHFYAPPAKDASKNKTKEMLSNENVTGALSDMSTKLDEFVKETQANQKTTTAKTPTNPVEKSMDSLSTQFKDFAEKAKQTNILQATVELLPPSSGTLSGKDVFYIWFKETLMPSGYRSTGKMIISDGNNSVEANFAEGTLKVNGKEVIGKDSADHTRLLTQDNRIPAEVVPMTLNRIAAPMNEGTVFEMNSYGEVKILNSDVLNCFQKAVRDQTGITYSGSEVTQVMGNLQAISTDMYGSVFARDTKIFLEGTAARMQGSSYSKFIINGFWNTKLVDGNGSLDSGKFVGMNFANGTIVLKPETNELVIWIRQHKDAILTSKDVKDLKATPTTVKDPATDCDTPAIDLEAVPFANDELGAQKVGNFNTSMNHLGPFTQFTTDKRIYEFYSKRDGNNGDCKNYFRVRDKDTGKILTDQEIVGPITQDADGTIKFRTADGKQQSLKFDAENGVPKVSYNGGAPETLLSAQGPKGSFWYDPNTGQWYPENGLQIPLNQAFKDNGAWFEPDKNGNVVGTPENKMTFNIGQGKDSSFNLPSMPETAAGIAVFMMLFLLVAFMTTQGRYKRKRKDLL